MRSLFGRHGRRKVNVPDLSGKTRSQAQTDLTSRGLNYSESSTSTSNSALNNLIQSQGVPAGNVSLIGDTVSVVYYNYVAPPVTPPVTPPVNPPVTPPVNPPVTPPVNPPVTPPVNPPVTPPVNPPVNPPVVPPVVPPVNPPVNPPVTPPVNPPVTPPVVPPVVPAGAVGTRCTSFDAAIGCCSRSGPCSEGFGSGANCTPITDFAPQSGC